MAKRKYQMKNHTLTEADHVYLTNAVNLANGKTAFCRRAMRVAQDVGVACFPNADAGRKMLNESLSSNRMSRAAYDLFMLTAEEVLKRAPTLPPNRLESAQSVTPVQAAVAKVAESATDERTRRRLADKSARIEELVRALRKAKDDWEKKREEALRLDGQLRATKTRVRELEARVVELEEAAIGTIDNITERQKIEGEMIDLLKEIVMAENGDIERHMLRAARLVIAQERA